MTIQQWLELLYPSGTQGTLELRQIANATTCRFIPVTEAGDAKLGVKTRAANNIYYGVTLRRDALKGDKSNLCDTHLVWVDLDAKGTRYVDDDPRSMPPLELQAAMEAMRDDVMRALEDMNLEPRAIVYSGHGLQLLFALDAPQPLETTEAINRWLARELADYGADPTVWNADRILRMPGSLNLKNPARPLEVSIWQSSEVANPLERFGQLEALPQTEGATYQTSGTISAADRAALLEAWRVPAPGKPGRHYLALGIAGWLKTNGWTEHATVALIAELAREAGDDETPDRVRAARDTFKADGNTRGWHTLIDDFKLTLEGLELKAPALARITPGADPERTAQKPKKPATRGMGYSDYRDLYLEHLIETGARLAHLERNQSWWVYGGGVYTEISEGAMRRFVDTALEGYDLSEGTLTSVLAKIARSDGVHRDRDELGARELNVANGILNLETLELRDHTPEFFSTVQTRASWDVNATANAWGDFLEFAVPQEYDRYCIQQYAGYALTGDTGYQVALFLIGEGRTGKGTLARVISALLGGVERSSLVAGVSFEALADGGHHLASLVGKRLAVISEMSRTLDWLTFKRITGEDAVLIDEKYKAPYSARLACKLLMLSNTMPNLGEDATNTSIIRRLLTVEMNQRPEAPDTLLETRLTHPSELGGILRWAVSGLQNLWQNDGFHTPQNTLTRDMVEQSNRVIAWFEDRAVAESSSKARSSDAFEDYRVWCAANGHRSTSSYTFKNNLIAAARFFGFEVTADRDRYGKHFHGLRLKGELLSGSQK